MDVSPPPTSPPPAWRLNAPTATVLRITCVGLLEEAGAATVRLRDPADAEALHDLRVALRRLRSQLRAFRPLLPRASAGKVRRALRELAAATGDARDREVQVAWLAPQREQLAPEHRHPLDALSARLARQHRVAMARVRHEVAALFPSVRRRLQGRLEEDEAVAVSSLGAAPGPRDGEARFGRAAAARIPAAAIELRDHARQVRSSRDEVQAHEARIAAKRLRYLVEPLRDVEPADVAGAARALVKRLRELQDLLGELHDAHVMGHVLERALVTAATAEARRAHRRVALPRAAGSPRSRVEGGGRTRPAPADPRPGLLALDRLACRRRDELFAGLRAARGARLLEGLVADSKRLAALLIHQA